MDKIDLYLTLGIMAFVFFFFGTLLFHIIFRDNKEPKEQEDIELENAYKKSLKQN
jgi:hypothetical protein